MYRKNLIKAHLRIKCKVKQTLHVKEERSCYIRNMTIKNNLHLCTRVFMYMLMHIYRGVHTCVGQKPTTLEVTYFLRQGSLMAWTTPNRLGRLSSDPQETACLLPVPCS